MKKTYSDLFVLIVNLNANIKEGKTKVEKKLLKIGEKIKKYSEEYEDKKNDIFLENASVDKDGILLTDEKGNYRYSKEGLKKRTSQLKELIEQEFEITPIPIINPEGLDKFTFLKDWVTGVDFVEEPIEEEVEL